MGGQQQAAALQECAALGYRLCGLRVIAGPAQVSAVLTAVTRAPIASQSPYVRSSVIHSSCRGSRITPRTPGLADDVAAQAPRRGRGRGARTTAGTDKRAGGRRESTQHMRPFRKLGSSFRCVPNSPGACRRPVFPHPVIGRLRQFNPTRRGGLWATGSRASWAQITSPCPGRLVGPQKAPNHAMNWYVHARTRPSAIAAAAVLGIQQICEPRTHSLNT